MEVKKKMRCGFVWEEGVTVRIPFGKGPVAFFRTIEERIEDLREAIAAVQRAKEVIAMAAEYGLPIVLRVSRMHGERNTLRIRPLISALDETEFIEIKLGKRFVEDIPSLQSWLEREDEKISVEEAVEILSTIAEYLEDILEYYKGLRSKAQKYLVCTEEEEAEEDC